jgi:crossover junction endodeoxyribonuclease RusA
MLTVTLDTKIESVMNLREHWSKRASRAKAQRSYAWAALRSAGKSTPKLLGPITVTLTRIAPRDLDDDNLRAGLKAVRDGVADWLGVPDNHPGITWAYAQEKGRPRQYAARIELEAACN